LRLRLEIEVDVHSEDLCKAILSSIEPDNVTAPQHTKIVCRCENGLLRVEVVSEGPILTFRNTVDDLLEHVAIAWKSIMSVLSKGKQDE